MKENLKNIYNLGEDLISVYNDYNQLLEDYEEMRIKAALFKAYFYGKDKIVNIINDKLLHKNPFNPFDIPKTLEIALKENILSKEQYDFCIKI